MYTPRIATHWTPEETETVRQMITKEAALLSESEITDKVQKLMTEGDSLSFGIAHDPTLQSSKDRMCARWIAECTEQAAMWCMAEGAA